MYVRGVLLLCFVACPCDIWGAVVVVVVVVCLCLSASEAGQNLRPLDCEEDTRGASVLVAVAPKPDRDSLQLVCLLAYLLTR